MWWRRLCTRVPRSASPSSPTGWGTASICSAGQLVTSPVPDTFEPSVADIFNFHADPDTDPDPGIKIQPDRQKLYYNVYIENIRFFLLVLNE